MVLGLLKVFTSNKSFALPVIGSPLLNKLGLHTFRMRLANGFLALRRFQVAGFVRPIEFQQFKRDGIVVLKDFLSESEFANLVSEVKNTMAKVDAYSPIQNYGDQGFGQKHTFDWGFDRYDGDTLNRFYAIKPEHKATHAFINNKRLKNLTSLFAGTYHDTNKYHLYKLFHGKEDTNADSQKAIHRDTFHSAIKLWYFLEDVKPEHGPFHYAPGTHRLTSRRLNWEKKRSIQASKENKGGAFRISNEALNTLGDGQLTSYPVKANTLVIADIRGFHCRGAALEHQSRLSIYANIRPAPFLPAFHSGKLKAAVNKAKGLFQH
ncbi:MAG: phytanoyl-CoA dioxygenase family protein [Bermanella sp.]